MGWEGQKEGFARKKKKLMSESGIALFFKVSEAPNPIMRTGDPYLTTEVTAGQASMTSVYETSVS